jgi:D-amino peptidase
MEGVAGAVTGDQLRPDGFEYARFREFMTREALAAVNAARAAGATEVLVADSHGNAENLLIEMFPRDVRVVRSWPRRGHMMAGLDATFDAALLIGYHASTANPRGVRAHTFSSARLTRVAVGGRDMSEGAWSAAIAGSFGVPVIMVSGDDAAIEELRAVVGPVEAAETKKALGFHSANTLTPEASCELIAAKVKAALARRREMKPFVLPSPVTVDLSFKSYMPAEVLSYLRAVERTDSHSIRFRAGDVAEASDFIEFVLNYSPSLEP